MRDLTTLTHNPTVESIVDVLCNSTQNKDRQFFRLLTYYYLTTIPSMMRVVVKGDSFNKVPINMYAINLATSGAGKGHSTSVIEDHIIHKFREHFISRTAPVIAESTITHIAHHRATRMRTDPDQERIAAEAEYDNCGPLVFSFDSGTVAAVKQYRHKLLLGGIGSMNFIQDEVGSNLTSNLDVLNAFLELFDLGKIKQKLVKSTKENTRNDELHGRTPANMLLFGTPSKLLNGSKVEDEFYEMLQTGYARRCFFGFNRKRHFNRDLTPEQMYDLLTDASSSTYLATLADKLAALADPSNVGMEIPMPKAVELEMLAYRAECDRRADLFSEHEEIKATEMSHRYFKVLKLAGALAFIEQSMNVTEDHLYQAIAMAEDSGRALEQILNRDKPYVKLASYICSIGRELTNADLIEELPFYKGSEAQKKEMMSLAIAHGYRNNMVIKRETIDGIDFFLGSSLPETSLDSVILSYSNDLAHNYIPRIGPWANIDKLCQSDGNHWCNTHFIPNLESTGQGGYRDEAHVKAGFNLVVLDVDGGISMDMVKELLKDYTFYMHTTKRHTPQAHRFRVVMPLSHVLTLDAREYKEFMGAIRSWLPFTIDDQTFQRSRKWLTHPGESFYNTGQLLDAFLFLPKTKKADEHKAKMATMGNMSALERWFVAQAVEGNRNNTLIRYAYALIDNGHDLDSIRNNVLALNSKLENPLPEMEVLSTILISASRKFHQKESQA